MGEVIANSKYTKYSEEVEDIVWNKVKKEEKVKRLENNRKRRKTTKK